MVEKLFQYLSMITVQAINVPKVHLFTHKKSYKIYVKIAILIKYCTIVSVAYIYFYRNF